MPNPLNEQSLSQDITRPVKKSYTDKDKKNTTLSRLLNAYITQRLPPFLNAAASGSNTVSKPGETHVAVSLDDTGEVSKPPPPSLQLKLLLHAWTNGEPFLRNILPGRHTPSRNTTIIHHNTYLTILGAATGRNHFLYATTLVTRCISEGDYRLGVREHTQ